MVELQPPASNAEQNDFAQDENSYQAKARRRNLVDESGNYIGASNPLPVYGRSDVDNNNSTTTPLDADATFTGTSTDILNYASMSLLVEADQASATGGLKVQYSYDESTWHDGEAYTIPADTTKFFTPPKQARYMRVVYTNGAVAQTSFKLYMMLNATSIKFSSHNLNDNLNDDDDGELGVTVLKLRTAQDNYVSAASTVSGNFKVSLEELENGISTNSNSQLNVSLYDVDGVGPAALDDSTNSIQTIEYEHHEIHSGSHYNYCDYSLNESSGAIIEFVMTTPNTTKWVHLAFEVSSSEGATIELYEGTTGVTGGTTITPRNNNRNSANTSDVTLVKDPSAITSDGIRASGYLAGGGRTAGFAERDREFVLKQNTAYLVRITSLAVSNDISWCAEWYEHTDKN